MMNMIMSSSLLNVDTEKFAKSRRMKTTIEIKEMNCNDYSDCNTSDEYNNKLYNFMNQKWYSEEEVQREKLKVLRDLRDDLQSDIKKLHKKYTEELDLLKYAEISKQEVD